MITPSQSCLNTFCSSFISSVRSESWRNSIIIPVSRKPVKIETGNIIAFLSWRIVIAVPNFKIAGNRTEQTESINKKVETFVNLLTGNG
jgi:hypothetical protein